MMFKKISFGWILCFSLAANAGEMGHTVNPYFISVSAGPGWTNAGSQQSIALQPDVMKTYVPQNLTNLNILGNGEIFLGVQEPFFEQVHSQYGVAFYMSTPAKLNGLIQEDGDPNFQNYTYQYRVIHQHIALKGKLIADNAVNVNPYFSASIGIGFNKAYRYAIRPLIFQEIPAPLFNANTQIDLSYSLGAGFQHTVNQRFTVALGYEFVAWGKSELGRAPGQTTGNGLRLNNLYTHGLVFNISYYLPE